MRLVAYIFRYIYKPAYRWLFLVSYWFVSWENERFIARWRREYPQIHQWVVWMVSIGICIYCQQCPGQSLDSNPLRWCYLPEYSGILIKPVVRSQVGPDIHESTRLEAHLPWRWKHHPWSRAMGHIFSGRQRQLLGHVLTKRTRCALMISHIRTQMFLGHFS